MFYTVYTTKLMLNTLNKFPLTSGQHVSLITWDLPATHPRSIQRVLVSYYLRDIALLLSCQYTHFELTFSMMWFQSYTLEIYPFIICGGGVMVTRLYLIYSTVAVPQVSRGLLWNHCKNSTCFEIQFCISYFYWKNITVMNAHITNIGTSNPNGAQT